MKKLKLEELNLGNEAEVLSREELKKVLGGMGSGGSGGGSGERVQTWLCSCRNEFAPDQCTVVGDYDSEYVFESDCFGYSGQVDSPAAHDKIDFCETYQG